MCQLPGHSAAMLLTVSLTCNSTKDVALCCILPPCFAAYNITLDHAILPSETYRPSSSPPILGVALRFNLATTRLCKHTNHGRVLHGRPCVFPRGFADLSRYDKAAALRDADRSQQMVHLLHMLRYPELSKAGELRHEKVPRWNDHTHCHTCTQRPLHRSVLYMFEHSRRSFRCS